jgi:hypothetical protein
MTEKVGGCHPRVIVFGFSYRDSIPWKCHPLFANAPPVFVIMRPPKDLAVLTFPQVSANT